MKTCFSAPAAKEHRLLYRMAERWGNAPAEGRDMQRSGVLANTRGDLGGLLRNITRLNLAGAAGNVLHAPISLVRDLGDGVAHAVDRSGAHAMNRS
jgi:hypothetical protein